MLERIHDPRRTFCSSAIEMMHGFLSLGDGSPEDFAPTTPFLHSAVTAAYLRMRWRHAPSYVFSSLTNIFTPMCFQLVISQ
jgi:hypothetical protein